MSARQQLEQLGVPADALDAYELEVRREVAEQLYATDNGSYEGCWCAQLIDPDKPCPNCDGEGGFLLGSKCDSCGLERTIPRESRKPGPSLVPQQFYAAMVQQLLGVQPLRPRPAYTGVLTYLEDGGR